MAGLLTIKYSVNAANSFLTKLQSSNSNYYVFAARPLPWSDESQPPVANGSVTQTELNIFKDLLFGKKISNNDVRMGIPRYQWTSNTVYSSYDQNDGDLYSKQFFVITDDLNVYKVLNNNDGAASTVKPGVVSNGVIRTSDNYVWKYMYTVDQVAMNKFATSSYIPIVPNTSVQTSAVSGTIDAVKINSGGSGWITFNTGFIQQVIASDRLVINSVASSNDNFYVNSSIYLKNGLGAGQVGKIVAYDSSTKVITLEQPLDVAYNLELANVTASSIEPGTIITQSATQLLCQDVVGSFESGDSIIQSTTAANGVIVKSSVGATRLLINKVTTANFANNLVVVGDDTLVLGTGTVTANITSNTIVGSGTNFTSIFSPLPQYIQIGTFVRRVTAVANNTSLTISGTGDGGFDSDFAANVYYRVPTAASVVTAESIEASGNVIFSDLDSIRLDIANINKSFVVGERVIQLDSASNGSVIFANTSTLILSNIEGPGFEASNLTTTFTVAGLQTTATANVVAVVDRPSITVDSLSGTLKIGAAIETGTGSAIIKSISTLPDQDTEYVISPSVEIDGDGRGFLAYATVNTSNYSIDNIVVINSGTGYSQANITVIANNNYGTGANLSPIISPLTGHGSNPAEELGGRYLIVSTSFGSANSEQYEFPQYGDYRTIGLIKDPLFNDVTLNLPVSNSTYQWGQLTVNSISGTFEAGELIYQTNTKSTAKIESKTAVGSNNSFVIKDIVGQFEALTTNSSILGLHTGATANVISSDLNVFIKETDGQIIYEQNTGATGILKTVNPTNINITNATGLFVTGSIVYDPTSNTYANVESVTTANNTKEITFTRFNNLARVTLTTTTGQFANDETVDYRVLTSNAELGNAVVYSTVDDIDLAISGNTLPFVNSEFVVQANTLAQGIVLDANASHIKLTGVVGQFANNPTYTITGQTSSATANVDAVYNVLVLNDFKGDWPIDSSNYILGLESGAEGSITTANSIIYPQLVRNTGDVLYIDNKQFIERTPTSEEITRLIVRF